MRLHDIAHSRAGDKGNISNISVIAYRAEGWPILKEFVTVERFIQVLGSIIQGRVERYELPKLAALNFVAENALSGGVTRSLQLDSHGKCLSSVLLNMRIPLSEAADHTACKAVPLDREAAEKYAQFQKEE